MTKTLKTCTKFLSKCTCVASLLSLLSCGKAVTTEETNNPNENRRLFLESKHINLSNSTVTYEMPGSAQLYLPEYIDFIQGNTENSLKLVFSKGVFMQEFTCYYDYSISIDDYELDECFLTDDPSESLGYEAGQEIYQAKGDTLELVSFENQVKAQIEVDWFSK